MIPAKWHAGTSIFRELAQSVGQRSLPHSRGQNPVLVRGIVSLNQVPMDATFCIEALTGALARHGKPDIFNTDQGSRFTGAAFIGALLGIRARALTPACAGLPNQQRSARHEQRQ
jgi:hypothetical protein